jgi:hypothetical protein
MSEEKKGEVKAPDQQAAPKNDAQKTETAFESHPAAPKADTAKPDTAPMQSSGASPSAQAPSQAPAPGSPAAAEKKEAPKKEKPANCEGCKKSIKKKRWYYRDGKYYCTKRCWTSAVKKAPKNEAAPAAS